MRSIVEWAVQPAVSTWQKWNHGRRAEMGGENIMNQELNDENRWEWSPSVLKAFETEVMARQKINGWYKWYCRFSLVFAVALLVYWVLRAFGIAPKVEMIWATIPTYLNYVILAIIRRRKNDAVRVASQRYEKSVVPGMVDLYTDWQMNHTFGEDNSELVAQTLRNLLPQVTSADQNLLPRDKAGRLAHSLLKEKREGLVKAGLAALGELGGVETEKSLAALAAGKGKCKTEAVKRTAGETLERVRFRTDHERSATTLLRPAGDGAASETLLRAVGTSQVTDPQVLLRPESS
jgi:hypothetical protein